MRLGGLLVWVLLFESPGWCGTLQFSSLSFPNVGDADMSHTILQGLVFALGSWAIGWPQISLGIGSFFELPEAAVDLEFSTEADPVCLRSKGCVGFFLF